MKKIQKGFTLAEVLITLGIIGVISALTLPTFTSNVRYQAMASKLSSTISSVENGFTAMLAAESADDLTETNFYEEMTKSSPNYTAAAGNLGTYLQLSNVKLNNNAMIFRLYGYDSVNPFKTLSDAALEITPKFAVQLKNGSILFINPLTSNNSQSSATVKSNGGSVTTFVARIEIDVNGSEKPNRCGRDVFTFALGDNGHLYPSGGRNLAIIDGDATRTWNNTSSPTRCDDTTKTTGCTGRLIENNYKIDF